MLRYLMLAGVLMAMAATALPGQTTPDAAAERRVEALLAQLTPEEKIDLLGGVDGFYTRGIERLNIPRLKMMDGPLGVRNDGPSTAYPTGILLAAAWNETLAAEMGSAIGRDARARGCHIVLGPAMNIYRVPTNGRNFEYLGEDPLLAARIAVAYIRGLQSQGVAACAKHFAANNQEDHRTSVNVVVDERTLHEIYLPAFKASVQEGGAWSIMTAYNRLNGPYCTASNDLQNEVLKKQWGFRGVVMSDWGATHETLNCLLGGLDLEMPSGEHLNREKILPLLADGRITQPLIDDKVRRLLRMMVAMEFLDREQKLADIPPDDERSAETALQVAREGLVLLKNDRGLLPLDAANLKAIAVVGPNADPAVTGGGGSSYVQPIRATSVLAGLRDRFKGEVRWITSSQLRDLDRAVDATRFEGALRASYFSNTRLRGNPAITRDEQAINFDWGDRSPASGIGPNDFSLRLEGTIRPAAGGSHTLYLRSDDGFRLKLDGRTILEDWNDHGAYTAKVIQDLQAGRDYSVEIEYYNAKGLAELCFGYMPTPQSFTDEEREAIRTSDAVVACVGFSLRTESEGYDRAYDLPLEQLNLLREVAAINPNVIVVLNAGGSVELGGWIDQVPALLHAWYPGQAGGQAIAETLLGENNPSGRLPISIEARREDALYAPYPGRDGHVEYTEGLFIGYRHYDRSATAPRFPFGFGLSYTSFDISSPQVTADADGWRISVDVANTGKRAGAQVVQAYVSPEEPPVVRPVKELKRFAKVLLQPGEKKRVQLPPLKREDLARYDAQQHAWVVDPGSYVLRIGASSRDLPIAERLTVR